jgi:hypothetical protein
MTGTVRYRRAVRGVVLAMVAVLALPLLPAHAADGVRTTRALELAPSAGPGVLAWTEAPRSHPARTRAYLRRSGQARIRLNARGTKGFTGGGAVDEAGNRVAYWQHADGKGTIKVFNLRKGRRTTPRFLNTDKHEWGAAISRHRLLFARGRFGGTMRLYIANFRNTSVRRLARVSYPGYLQPGDLTGRWATWARCTSFSRCRVVRLNLRTRNRVTLANPRNRSQFAPSVLADGTVVYGESGNIATCDSRLRLFVKPRAADRRRFGVLPAGTSISATSVKRVGPAKAAVFYDQQRCDAPRANIYRTSIAA